MRTAGILVAAGRGRRFGGPKHAVELKGLPLWEWGRRALLDGGVDEVVMVGPVPDGIPGGRRRRDSVAAGLGLVSADVVLVHDAARPLATPKLTARIIERLAVGDAEGVVPAVAVRDALKRVEGERVTATIEGAMAVQTPQGFLVEALRRSHELDDEDAADDAALLERAGYRVVAILGEHHNLKITYRSDLRRAESFLELGEQ